jgi:predicted nuclease of predicted toxin-antitoxin system
VSIQILIDMNLSPDWAAVFERRGWAAIHWSAIGDERAPDRAIMEWARLNEHIVFTHDLDFGTLLALTQAAGPSVIQVRAQDVLPSHLEPYVVAAIEQHEALLATGALIVVDESVSRARILPLRTQE